MSNSETRERLGNYRLIRLLGLGGFAEVYLGEHIYLKTPAAIKVLRMRLVNETLENFLTEARTIAHLEHPHIVRVLEFGMEKQTPYLVMAYAPNGTIRRHHPKGSILPLSNIVLYVKQIADALQYAHDSKLIHRDIKPDNILLGRNDEVLLSDFGLAVVSQSSRNRRAYGRAGTTLYMAPEQLQGKPSRASDQYALGIVTYEWLCGQPPFTGTDQEIALQHIQATPLPLHERVPNIPPVIEQVVMRALAKDPYKRFTRIQHFAQALEQAYRSHKSALSQLSLSGITPKTPGQTRPLTPEIYDAFKSASIVLEPLKQPSMLSTMPTHPEPAPLSPAAQYKASLSNSSSNISTKTYNIPSSHYHNRPEAVLPDEIPLSTPSRSSPNAPHDFSLPALKDIDATIIEQTAEFPTQPLPTIQPPFQMSPLPGYPLPMSPALDPTFSPYLEQLFPRSSQPLNPPTFALSRPTRLERLKLWLIAFVCFLCIFIAGLFWYLH